MQLKRARISHFRSLKNITIDFASHTAFIGGNGAGKSSILKALERFYSTAKTLEADDFFGRDQSVPIEIELTFGELTDDEKKIFESRVRADRLTVTRVFDTSPTSGRYYGVVPQNRDFVTVRSQPNATAKRDAYKALQAMPAYAELPNASSADAVMTNLAAWEVNHPEALTPERDDGQFFGFQNASRGALARHTSFVFVPAVREASVDAADSKTSPIGQLLQILVRSSILKRAEVQKFQAEMAERYAALVAPENMPELGDLAGILTADLKQLYGEAAVGLDWREVGEFVVPLPAADVTLSDDGFGGPVDRQGHGLQRALVFTLLQHLARASSTAAAEGSQPENQEGEPVPPAAPNLILAVEEPELYQHPTKQRHLAQVLRRLSTQQLPGTVGTTQIAFASHSPMFISLRHADEIRLVRRTDCAESEFKQCDLKALNLEEVAGKLALSQGKPATSFSEATLKPRLHILGTELAEGFFANGIVLIEGRSDRAALFATARTLGVDFEAAGIAVLSAEGKTNLDRPYLIFKELGIPIYVVWDCDCGTKDYKPALNLNMARLVSPDALAANENTSVQADHAHFECTLEKCLKEELGTELYEACLKTACDPYGFDASQDAQKIPDIMYELLAEAKRQGRSSQTLEALVIAIWKHIKSIDLATETGKDQ